jgi:hypothetical protein
MALMERFVNRLLREVQMATTRTIGWGLVGAATTMLARRATRRAMHQQSGAPRLPRATRANNSFGMMLLLAASAGAMLALGDVLKEQRQHATQTP